MMRWRLNGEGEYEMIVVLVAMMLMSMKWW